MSTNQEPRASSTLSDRVQSLRLPSRGGVGSSGKLPWVLCVLLLASTLTFGYQAFRKPGGESGPEGDKGGSPIVATRQPVTVRLKRWHMHCVWNAWVKPYGRARN